MLVGYARVSTEDQKLDLQKSALQAAGCERIYEDHGVSGSDFDREGLHAALASLKPGETLVVWRLDRLGRSLIGLIHLIDRLGKRKVQFRSVMENIDTTSPGGRLMFHMMAALAEFERALISERTRAGLVETRARGQILGRPRALASTQLPGVIQAIRNQRASMRDVAKRYGVSVRTLQRYLSSHDTTSYAEIAPPDGLPRDRTAPGDTQNLSPDAGRGKLVGFFDDRKFSASELHCSGTGVGDGLGSRTERRSLMTAQIVTAAHERALLKRCIEVRPVANAAVLLTDRSATPNEGLVSPLHGGAHAITEASAEKAATVPSKELPVASGRAVLGVRPFEIKCEDDADIGATTSSIVSDNLRLEDSWNTPLIGVDTLDDTGTMQSRRPLAVSIVEPFVVSFQHPTIAAGSFEMSDRPIHAAHVYRDPADDTGVVERGRMDVVDYQGNDSTEFIQQTLERVPGDRPIGRAVRHRLQPFAQLSHTAGALGAGPCVAEPVETAQPDGPAVQAARIAGFVRQVEEAAICLLRHRTVDMRDAILNDLGDQLSALLDLGEGAEFERDKVARAFADALKESISS